jgi:hypothetical protein
MEVTTKKSPETGIDRLLGFVKEGSLWFADLPEFLEAGRGDRNDLLMLAGSDTLLDPLTGGGTRIQLRISDKPFDGDRIVMHIDAMGLDKELLDSVGHNPVDYGAYDQVTTLDSKPFRNRLWLCPVAEYVFGGYSRNIYASIA